MTRIRVISIKDLLNNLSTDTPDTWVLPLAQRAFVWKDVQITRLVDSLLKGFPVGSILLSDSEGPHFELKGPRRARHGSTETHLLDGQQRSLSLRASYGGAGWVDPVSGHRMHLWINLTQGYPEALYDAFNPNHNIHGHLFHLRWFSEHLGNPNRWKNADRKREGFRTGKHPTPVMGWVLLSDVIKHPRRNVETWWKRWSNVPPSEEIRDNMARILQCIRKSYSEPCIPIHILESGANNPRELFQIFIRLNSAGTPLGAAEQFFAGVKQHWHEAEERLNPLYRVAGPLQRKDLITLVARTAAKIPMKHLNLPVICRQGTDEEVTVADPIPIRLERLARAPEVQAPDAPTGTTRNLLIWKMDALTQPGGPMPLEQAMDWVRTCFFKRLYLGILGIHPISWNVAVIWALGYWSRTGQFPPDEEKWVQPLLRFCFWTSAVNSNSEGKRKFERNSFNLGWQRGFERRPFPFMLKTKDPDEAEACKKTLDMSFGYARVRKRIPSEANQYAETHDLMRDNKWLFLGPYQRIGEGWSEEQQLKPRIEWDHIFARVLADRFLKESSRAKDTGRKKWRRSRYHKWTHRIGNFAGIDSSANRGLSDKTPKQKLAYRGKSKKSRQKTYMDEDYIRTAPQLDPECLQLLFRLDTMMERQKRKEGGEAFEAFAARRGDHIWNQVIRILGAGLTQEQLDSMQVQNE